ncbi:SPOR domain-containing protein [uncultured Sphingomonas sp.]|uniref:SPOR domain-containing protein n=1 Tax=uncultured Sphingomonas sp. TaxID=158754 RepID=UPI0030D9E55C
MSDVPPPRAGRIAAAGIAALLLAACPAAVAAQQLQMVQALNPDADRLADTMRRLGASPRDLSALIEAGDLSFRLGDVTAAAAFYKRAEAVDPHNGRVHAGIGRILVNGERPGEALRYFELAQRYGAPMAEYAGDRGLAYDLVGEQERAQRDYRAALARGGADADLDEVRRRYALSLGISGRQEEALAQIDTLLRRSDRGAWRARAFVMAMNGDVAGANRIASGMMPAGMAQGLAAFFQRLPTLSATDRAFAVHFGEVAATPARLADARLTPALPPLGIDPTAPRQQIAAVAPSVARPLSRAEQRQQQRAAQLAARQASRGAAAPVSVPPVAYAARSAAASSVPGAAPAPATPTPAPAQRAPAATSSASPTPAAQVASIAGAQRPPAAIPPAGSTVAGARVAPGVSPSPAPGYASAAPATAAPSTGGTRPAPSVQTATATPPAAAVPTPAPSAAAGTTAPSPSVAPRPEQAANTAVAAATATPGFSTTTGQAPTPAPAAAPAQVASTTPARPTAIGRGEDSILARIVAGITIPASELDVPPMPGAVPVVAPPPAPGSAASLEEAARVAERNAAADEEKRERLIAKRQAERAAAAAKAAADKKAKELAAKKEAAEKLAAEKKAARAEPERIWVQVAGGANEGDLPKAWKAVQAKASALAGRRAYATPLRATNRVVTGPFKTEAEARAFVNTLAKQGVSAFSFTSAPGQKMTRLDTK